jgi:hypothetical protein
MDVLIYMPESDALSASALETIYAGNILVAGAWLPYGPFRRLGLPFVEVEEYDQLSTVIPGLLNQPRMLKSELDALQQKIDESFLPNATVPSWIRIYSELMRGRYP